MIAQWRIRQQAQILDNQTGTIVSWTKVCVAPEPFDVQVPYFLALIAVDDHKRMLCPVVDCNEAEITVGVCVQFVTRIIHSPTANSIITYGIKAVIKKV
jgi:uncharacterized OB-fold protein